MQVVEVFDLTTKNIISPWRRLEHFGNGTYLVWRYEGSVRFRVSYLRSEPDTENAVLQALFFDA